MTQTQYEIVATHRWLSLCKGFEGEPFIKSSSGTLVVPITDDGDVLFILEPRRVNGELVLSLPGGGINADEDTAISANRELQEEIGFYANKLDFLATLNPAVRVTDWEVHVYLGRDLVPSKLEGDESYEIQVEKIPLSQFETVIQSGRLMDSTLIAALYLTRSFINRAL